ncbi:hypothetical protein WDW89_24970 [Deltaproteobacteria bacterium TL4]
MKKIKISEIAPDVLKLQGFSSGSFGGCLSRACGSDQQGGACCHLGVNTDKESYDLILKHRKLVEEAIELKFEDCFNSEWNGDPEFLGRGSIGTRVRKKDNYCVFHSAKGKGCELVSLVIKNKLPRRMIPSACRLYPITWDKGRLFLSSPIFENCDCLRSDNPSKKTIFDTQKKAIDNIFEIIQ